MNATYNKQNITNFTKHTLGCGCPDKVFEKIEVSKIPKSGSASQVTRINIGDTLLIYIIHPDSEEELKGNVKHLTSIGREDKVSNNFNRFRLVVAGDEAALNTDVVVNRFATEVSNDEKMHIHFVKAETIDGL